MAMNETIDPRTLLTIKALTVGIDAVNPDLRILLSAATIIRQGGVVAHPTETVYGLAADPFNADAVAQLEAIKRRMSPRPLILLISQAGNAWDVARLGGPARQWYETLTRAFWPGPLTLVLHVKHRLDCPALAGGDTVAVRVSSHPVALRLTQTVGRPITSTSANITGGAPAATAQDIDPALAHRLGLILDGGPAPGTPVSTILDLTRQRPTLLRAETIGVTEIERVLGFKPRSLAAA
jgi:L-threonylcarbamoyladenylate synthase